MEGSPVWSLGDLRLDPEIHRDVGYHTGTGVHWFLTKEEGFWGSPGSTAEITQSFNRHGGVISPGWKQERIISLTGYAYAPDYAQLRQAATRLSGMLADPYTGAILTCHSEIGDLTAEVYLDGEILVKTQNTATPSVEWSLQLVAPDPRKYAPDWTTRKTPLPSPGRGGLDFGTAETGLDFSDPGLEFGPDTGSDGRVLLENTGTAPAPALLGLHGPLSVPTITASVGDEIVARLTYNAAIPAGTFIEIDTRAPSVRVNGQADRRYLVSPAQFSGFTVPGSSFGGTPGALSLQLSHTGDTDASGFLLAQFRTAWF